MREAALEGLNDAQRAAVEHAGTPLLILAGAGSGKTRVVTHRIARLIDEGADPASILAVTFTNKAAREMRQRAIALAGPAAEPVAVSTFHSACARVLRRHAHRVGLGRGFSIYDQDDQAVLLRELCEELGMPHDAAAVREARARVEAAKHRALRVTDVQTEATSADSEAFADLFAAYQAALLRANACDFGDLIAHLVHALQDDDGFRAAMRDRIRHLLVDEFQDTNSAQYELIRLLAPVGGDVAVVGDDDQAIYGWRGATVENVRRFRDELDGCEVVALEQNYRSGPTILDAAHAIVSVLPERMDKRLVTDRQDRQPVRAFVGSSDREEADFVVREIARLRHDLGLSYDDFAVFFRTNAQSRVLEERMRAAGVPHAMRGAQAWFDRREIRDVLAYMRLAANPADEVAFRRIANVPARGIGKGTLRKVVDFHDAGGFTSHATSLRAFVEQARRLQARTRRGLEELASLLESIEGMAARLGADEVLQTIVTETDYEAYIESNDPMGGEERARNVRDLVESAHEFCAANDDDSVLAFVEQAALAGADDEVDDGSRVQLMTVHAAKGLEFPVVFVTGLEAGQFPLHRRGEVEDPDEERRLCYVAFTRARDRLYVSAAMRRRLFGQTRENDPSEFLLELPDELVEMVSESATPERDWAGARKQALRSPRRRPPEFEFDQRTWQERHGAHVGAVPDAGLVFGAEIGGAAPSRHSEPAAPSALSEPEPGLVGRRVRHRTFGDGTVVATAEVAGKTTLTIDFPHPSEPGGTVRKRVVRKYVELV